MQPNGPGRYPGPPQQSMTGPMRGGAQGPFPPQQLGRPGPAQSGPRPGAGYKGNQSARAPEQPAAASGPTITAAALASAGPAEQKQMLGEALYPRITESVPQLAGVRFSFLEG